MPSSAWRRSLYTEVDSQRKNPRQYMIIFIISFLLITFPYKRKATGNNDEDETQYYANENKRQATSAGRVG